MALVLPLGARNGAQELQFSSLLEVSRGNQMTRELRKMIFLSAIPTEFRKEIFNKYRSSLC